MKPKDLKQKSNQELVSLLSENREKLRQFRFDLSAGKVKDIRSIRGLKKDIARILTLISLKN